MADDLRLPQWSGQRGAGAGGGAAAHAHSRPAHGLAHQAPAWRGVGRARPERGAHSPSVSSAEVPARQSPEYVYDRHGYGTVAAQEHASAAAAASRAAHAGSRTAVHTKRSTGPTQQGSAPHGSGGDAHTTSSAAAADAVGVKALGSAVVGSGGGGGGGGIHTPGARRPGASKSVGAAAGAGSAGRTRTASGSGSGRRPPMHAQGRSGSKGSRPSGGSPSTVSPRLSGRHGGTDTAGGTEDAGSVHAAASRRPRPIGSGGRGEPRSKTLPAGHADAAHTATPMHERMNAAAVAVTETPSYAPARAPFGGGAGMGFASGGSVPMWTAEGADGDEREPHGHVGDASLAPALGHSAPLFSPPPHAHVREYHPSMYAGPPAGGEHSSAGAVSGAGAENVAAIAAAGGGVAMSDEFAAVMHDGPRDSRPEGVGLGMVAARDDPSGGRGVASSSQEGAVAAAAVAAITAPRSAPPRVSDYTILKCLGKGTYGQVHKVRRNADGAVLVLKQVPMDGLTKKERTDALNEAEVMSQVRHEHVIKYHHSFIDDDKLNIVMDFAQGGDLGKAIKAAKEARRHFPEELLWDYLIQICGGLKHMHDKRILHRDIKPQNIFLGSERSVKIGDFGLGRILGPHSAFARTAVGTPLYFSPELCEEKRYNERSDMWALGCLMYELATFKPPFMARNQIALAKKIVRDTPTALPKEYSMQLQFLIFKLLEKDMSRRPDATQVLNYTPVRLRIEQASLQMKEQHLAARCRDVEQRCEARVAELEARLATARQDSYDLQRAAHAAEQERESERRGTAETLRQLQAQVSDLASSEAELQARMEEDASRAAARARAADDAAQKQLREAEARHTTQLAEVRAECEARIEAERAQVLARADAAVGREVEVQRSWAEAMRAKADEATQWAQAQAFANASRARVLAGWQAALHRATDSLKTAALAVEDMADAAGAGGGDGTGAGDANGGASFTAAFAEAMAALQDRLGDVDVAATAVARTPAAPSPSADVPLASTTPAMGEKAAAGFTVDVAAVARGGDDSARGGDGDADADADVQAQLDSSDEEAVLPSAPPSIVRSGDAGDGSIVAVLSDDLGEAAGRAAAPAAAEGTGTIAPHFPSGVGGDDDYAVSDDSTAESHTLSVDGAAGVGTDGVVSPASPPGTDDDNEEDGADIKPDAPIGSAISGTDTPAPVAGDGGDSVQTAAEATEPSTPPRREEAVTADVLGLCSPFTASSLPSFDCAYSWRASSGRDGGAPVWDGSRVHNVEGLLRGAIVIFGVKVTGGARFGGDGGSDETDDAMAAAAAMAGGPSSPVVTGPAPVVSHFAVSTASMGTLHELRVPSPIALRSSSLAPGFSGAAGGAAAAAARSLLSDDAHTAATGGAAANGASAAALSAAHTEHRRYLFDVPANLTGHEAIRRFRLDIASGTGAGAPDGTHSTVEEVVVLGYDRRLLELAATPVEQREGLGASGLGPTSSFQPFSAIPVPPPPPPEPAASQHSSAHRDEARTGLGAAQHEHHLSRSVGPVVVADAGSVEQGSSPARGDASDGSGDRAADGDHVSLKIPGVNTSLPRASPSARDDGDGVIASPGSGGSGGVTPRKLEFSFTLSPGPSTEVWRAGPSGSDAAMPVARRLAMSTGAVPSSRQLGSAARGRGVDTGALPLPHSAAVALMRRLQAYEQGSHTGGASGET